MMSFAYIFRFRNAVSRVSFTTGFFEGVSLLDRARAIRGGPEVDTTRSRRIVSRTECRGRLRPVGAAGGLPERSRNAPRMRASDIRPHCPPHAASAVVPCRRCLLRPFVLRLYLCKKPPCTPCFTDSAMMHRETIDIDMGRGERERDKSAMGRISAGYIARGYESRCIP